MTPEEKRVRYQEVTAGIRAMIAEEPDLLAAMAAAASLLHQTFPYFFWTGFYRRVGPRRLLIGPYQGTPGCLDIAFGRGVCGACAEREETVIVADVHDFPGHIACDAASVSEIVVPVFDEEDRLIAVLDVDSTEPAAFDEADRDGLEEVAALLGDREVLPVVNTG